MRGLLIAFEGNEGSGKTTQSDLLLDHLTTQGHAAIKVHEPGSTPLGDHLRTFLKQKRPIHTVSELLLFAAARAELVRRIMVPALNSGTHVIADRYRASSVAYQGFARGIDLDTVETLNKIATEDLLADLTFWLDIEPAQGIARADADDSEDTRYDRNTQNRRFEDQPLNFHNLVRAGYAHQSKEKGWHQLDATLSVTDLADAINQATSQYLTR